MRWGCCSNQGCPARGLPPAPPPLPLGCWAASTWRLMYIRQSSSTNRRAGGGGGRVGVCVGGGGQQQFWYSNKSRIYTKGEGYSGRGEGVAEGSRRGGGGRGGRRLGGACALNPHSLPIAPRVLLLVARLATRHLLHAPPPLLLAGRALLALLHRTLNLRVRVRLAVWVGRRHKGNGARPPDVLWGRPPRGGLWEVTVTSPQGKSLGGHCDVPPGEVTCPPPATDSKVPRSSDWGARAVELRLAGARSGALTDRPNRPHLFARAAVVHPVGGGVEQHKSPYRAARERQQPRQQGGLRVGREG